MSLIGYAHSSPARLADQLLRADAATPELMTEVIARAGGRFAALRATREGVRIRRLAEAGAWTDAALALLALELPQWKLRRLTLEDGEWLCTLGRHPGLPVWLDDIVEARHGALPLALLSALVRAREAGKPAAARPARTVPPHPPGRGLATCCDNFR